ncbi:UbiA family prenyltransferase [Natrinema salifodinae]|uniref:4-hydroxybenzoate polyprenyltransferase n=1 Tax=Natrinema salifodinae TaxID=1202768 RepID=A0A1I0MBX1_9EURY|nr:UbiA family prenyltransferase [Natrinema salifodinae]SEV85739.1 4-hydroxybenzoate polyprenyltransferase [Natrinema salifodinae]
MNNPTATRRTTGWASSITAVLRFLIHSNLFISLATVSVAVTTIRLANLPLEPLPLFIVFAATMFVYTVNRFTDIEEDEQNVPRRAAFTRRYGRYWLTAGVALYVAAIGAAIALGLPGVAYLLLPLAVVLLYSVGGVKQFFLVKNLVVGLAWGAIPLGVGYYYAQLRTLEVLFLFVYVTAMITIAAVIFDVKDIEGDRAEGIPTVPNLFGPEWTRVGSLIATVAVAAAVVTLVATGALPWEYLVVLAMNAYVCAYIPFATPDRGPLYYGFVVDGEHVFLAAVVLTLEWLVW